MKLPTFCVLALSCCLAAAGPTKSRRRSDKVKKHPCAERLVPHAIDEDTMNFVGARHMRGAVPSNAENLEMLRRFQELRSQLMTIDKEAEPEAYVQLQKAAQDVKHTIVLRNFPLAVDNAQTFLRIHASRLRGTSLDDLIVEAVLGLDEAVECFDFKFGTQYSTFAFPRIRGRLTRAIQRYGSVVSRPKVLQDDLANCLRTLESRGDHRTLSQLTDAEVIEVLEQYRKERELEPIAYTSGHVTRLRIVERLGFGIADWDFSDDARQQGDDPAEAAAESEMREMLGAMVNQLDEREQRLIRMRFGLDGYKPHTLLEIGRELGVTRERVRQLEAEALETMRMRYERDMRLRARPNTRG